MKKLLSIILSAIAVQAGAQGQFVINGVLPDNGLAGQTIYLRDVNNSVIDSCTIVENTFKLKGAVSQAPQPALVGFNPQQSSIVILEPGEITFQSSQISGTPANDSFQTFFSKLRSMPDSELNLVVYEYLKENMPNAVGEFLLSAGLANMLKPAQFNELIKLARPEFRKQLAETPLLPPAIGDKYIDLKLKNLEGKEASVSDYVAGKKYVLIDFWASWCGPCIRENPTLVKAYAKYHDKGFEIIGLSLDEHHDRWAQAVKRLEITWPQLSDLGGWGSLAARTYKVNSIPASFLLNEKGEIIARDLRGEELLLKLGELLGE